MAARAALLAALLLALVPTPGCSFRRGPGRRIGIHAGSRGAALQLLHAAGGPGDKKSQNEEDEYIEERIREVLDAMRQGMTQEEFGEAQRKKREASFEEFRREMKDMAKVMQRDFERDEAKRKREMNEKMDKLSERLDDEFERMLTEFRANASISKADWEQKYAAPLAAAPGTAAGRKAIGDKAVAKVEAQLEKRR
eukprot:CAMPEP_0118862394 /NCGR_PEP_ID=MMETSP1163-20130328/7609_1 /TAXON_ID=124430 /ORGANISM="Phaeomonas parva, Strain CCMP2877" /LENGTH=195 /DNA_ID=CAMNT_0006796297 /DNA_START=247 /DNA_END=831 /DNA_ORIENTATION=+